ncbi:MAG: hypothetical protein CYG59_21360 [Chloroflexi bacterium]|nr:MAG: hypothetical protein CYG59_21360 [Chloroflexota bacterium]
MQTIEFGETCRGREQGGTGMTQHNQSAESEVVQRHKQVDELFQQTLPAGEPVTEHHVPLNLFESSRQVVVHLALPGCRESGIRLFLDGTTLTVRAERHVGVAEAHETRFYLVHEVPMGTLVRRIPLPAVGLQTDAIKAYFADGMLTVVIPKDEAHQVRELPIHGRRS